MVPVGVGGGVLVHLRADFFQQQQKVLRFGFRGRVFPVDVDAVETPVFDERQGRSGELGARFGGGGGQGEAAGRGLGVGPAADGEEDADVAVGFFEEVELFDAAVDVGAVVVPGWDCCVSLAELGVVRVMGNIQSVG